MHLRSFLQRELILKIGYDNVHIDCIFHFFLFLLYFIVMMDDNQYGVLQLRTSYG